MSFMIRWDADKIVSDLRACSSQVKSPYNDGFIQWGCKKDLLKVKYALDEMLSDCPTFHGEDEFIAEQEKKQTWKILSKGN